MRTLQCVESWLDTSNFPSAESSAKLGTPNLK